MTNIILIVSAILVLLLFLFMHLRHRHPIRASCTNMVLGVAALVGAKFILEAVGVALMINLYTTFIALALGIPGVIAMVAAVFLL